MDAPEKYKQLTEHYREYVATQREGQAWFNALYVVDPILANQIRGGVADPFYLDERLPSFHEKVTAHWQ